MKQNLLRTAFTICAALFANQMLAQPGAAIVVDYSTWSSSNCNVFASLTNVPVTVGGTASTIGHKTEVGQPTYASSDHAIGLATGFDNNGATLGTRYRLVHTFVTGFKYMITVRAKVNIFPADVNKAPFLKLLVTNAAMDASVCSGSGYVQGESGTNSYVNRVTSTSYADYQFQYQDFHNTFAFLTVESVPAPAGYSYTIEVQKITITPTLVPPSFTLSPATSPIICGSTANQNFSVANNSSTYGITNYAWNLGSTPNGWRYNGAAAPAVVNTSANTLSLTPDCGQTHKTIFVNVSALGSSYPSNNATFTNTTANIYMNGASNLCSGSTTYSVTGVCSPTVTYSSSNNSIATVTTSNNVATLTKVGIGVVTITAHIVSSCFTGNRVKDIGVGVKTPTITYTFQQNSHTSYIFTADATGPLGYDWYEDGVKKRTNADAVWYLEIPCNEQHTISAFQTTSCGTSGTGSLWVWNTPCTPSFVVSPNPTDDELTVQAVTHDASAFSKSSTSSNSKNVSKLTLFNRNGTIQKQWKVQPSTNGKVQVSLRGLPIGTYVLEITYDGKKEIQQVMVK